MSRRVAVREIAHARAGDKGNRSNISVWVYDPKHYIALRRELTAERVAGELRTLVRGSVVRYELPHLGGLNFVMDEALEGGVNTSLNLDGHGKSWSGLILRMEIDIDD